MMRPSTRIPVFALAAVSLLTLGACQNWFRGGDVDPPALLPETVTDAQDAQTRALPPDLASMPGIDEACGEGFVPCRDGLACIEGTCRAIGTSTTGTTCLLSDECTDGLVCGLEGRCTAEGAGALGALCVRPDGCQKGYVCASAGIYGTCVVSGTGDLGDGCAITRDCLSGLFCSSEGTCNTPSPFYGYEGWQGIDCAATDEGAPRVFFELEPRSDGDFFRHPFPSDLRLTAAGTPDLSSFPRPGGGLAGRDAVENLMDAAMENQRGFSTTPTVLFRFSHAMDLDTFTGKDQEGSPATVRYVNIEPESKHQGTGQSFNWYVTTGRGRYVCPRWAAFRTAASSPLNPKEQHAVLLLKGVSTASGVEFEVDSDLEALLQGEAPADAALATAWADYANLRAYMDQEAIPAENVVGAAVFTPGSPQEVTGAVSGAIAALPVPAPAQATFCEGAAKSPCDDGASGEAHVRGCLGSPPGVDEIHFKLDLPVVQHGQRPYEASDSGGDVPQAADGSISITSTESVCVSMAVSNAQAMPPTGWPLVIVAPDIGDTYRSAVDALGPMVTGLEHEGTPSGAIVVSWEAPLHGARATSEHAPLARVRNFMNPGAARGNVLQAVADFSEILRAVSTINWTADVSPTGQALAINPAQIAVVGHGHGATIASLAAAQEQEVDLLVLSGGGADVAATWLGRMEPIEAQTGLALALSESDDEGPMTISQHHPAMLRFSSFMNAVDPVNHLHHLASKPLDGLTRKHVLNVFGVEDPNVSPDAARLFARRLAAPIVGTVLDTISGLNALEAPASLTMGPAQEPVTAGTIQAAGQEGASSHDVFFDDPGVQAQVDAFLATWLATGEPVIIERP